MTLVRKSLIFTSIVIAIQLLVVGSLVSVLNLSEDRVKRLQYSRNAVYGSLEIVNTFNDAIFRITENTLVGDSKDSKLYESAVNKITSTLKRLRNDQYTSKQDLVELDRLANEANFLIAQLTDWKTEMENNTSQDSVYVKLVASRAILIPYLKRMTITANKFNQRHLKQQRTIENATNPSNIKSILMVMFLVNLLITIVTVVGFNRSIVRRLALVISNFRLFAGNQPLLPGQQGTDEIAEVDREFHVLTQALSEASEKDKAVFSNMPVGLITCNQEGQIQDLNPYASAWLADNTQGKFFQELVDEPQRFTELLKGTVSGSIRGRITTRQGQRVLAEVSASRFVHKSVNYVLLAIVDLSEREEMENRRQEFVSVVSHDIRTPITSADLLLDLMEQEKFSPVERAAKHCARARMQLTNIMKLTSDLLDIARIESGSVKLNKEFCSVAALVEQAVEAVTMQAQRAEISIIQNSIEDLIECDFDRIQQVLLNFLSNAVKFTPSGKKIEVTARRDADFVRIAVSDEGIGIPASEIGVVFDRFKQARKEDSKKGTGLGLAICKMMVESHGGRIGVNSIEGSGSEFWIMLPIEPSSEAVEVEQNGLTVKAPA
jgi:PAS domain S-box-containing protein